MSFTFVGVEGVLNCPARWDQTVRTLSQLQTLDLRSIYPILVLKPQQRLLGFSSKSTIMLSARDSDSIDKIRLTQPVTLQPNHRCAAAAAAAWLRGFSGAFCHIFHNMSLQHHHTSTSPDSIPLNDSDLMQQPLSYIQQHTQITSQAAKDGNSRFHTTCTRTCMYTCTVQPGHLQL